MGIGAAAYSLNCFEMATATADDAVSLPMHAMMSLRPAVRTTELINIQPS
jgi:hypothetical protein